MTEKIVFDGREAARPVRNDQSIKPFLADSDDARTGTVELKDKTPERVISRVVGEAAETREKEAEKYGSAELTESERDRIDFTKTDVFTAQSAKAAALGNGVSDWISQFDETLTASENRDRMKSASTSGGGRRNEGRETGQNAKRLAQANKRRKAEAGDRVRDFAILKQDKAAQEELRSRGGLGEVFDIQFFRRDGRLEGSGKDFDRLQEVHESRSQRAQSVDERRQAKTTRDPVQWANNPDKYDYPGIDTVQPNELHEKRSERAQQADESELAPPADTKEQWANNQDQYDWPGVDTPPAMALGPNQTTSEPAEETGDDRPKAALAVLGPEGQEDETDTAGFLLSQRDVSAAPEELTQGVGLGSPSAPGGQAYDARLGRPVETDRPEQEQQPPQEAINDQSGGGGGFTDDRGRDGSLTSFGMETDGSVFRESRQDQESATEFGVDDRSREAVESDDGDDSEQQGFEVFGGGVRENETLF